MSTTKILTQSLVIISLVIISLVTKKHLLKVYLLKFSVNKWSRKNSFEIKIESKVQKGFDVNENTEWNE